MKTLLGRLLAKGALAHEPRGKAYVYRPAVKRDDCVRQESDSFLDRVFGGAAAPLLAHFVTFLVFELTILQQRTSSPAEAAR